MQVKESVSSSGSPPRVTGLLLFVLDLVSFVLLLLMLSPTCVDIVFKTMCSPYLVTIV